MTKFVPCDREQPFLVPVDMSDWVPSDDLAHFVIEAVDHVDHVDHVDFQRFRVNERGTGSAQYEPRMMLALLIYCYASGIFSSRRIERATYRDIGVRFVAANLHPDHDTTTTPSPSSGARTSTTSTPWPSASCRCCCWRAK